MAATGSTTKPSLIPHERTLAIIKPNAIAKCKEIEEMIAKRGFVILHKKKIQLTREQAQDFYSEHESKSFFNGLVEFMTSGPVQLMVLASQSAVDRWRDLIGPTDPKRARQDYPESIRAMYSGKENPENAVHGSDSPENAEKEINFFFPELSSQSGDLAREYLAKTVNPVLLKGLVQLCRQKPENPVVWLADWLLANNPNKPIIE